MSSVTAYFGMILRSARDKSSSDIASIVIILVGVAAILLLLSPPFD
jgi:hypothetical protein